MAIVNPLVYRANNVVGTPSPGDKLPSEFIPHVVPVPFSIVGQLTMPASVGPSSIGATVAIPGNVGKTVFTAFAVDKPKTAVKIAVNVTTGSSGILSVGVYGLNANNEPGDLLYNHDFTDVTVAGLYEVTVNLALDAGVYYAAVGGTATATVTGVQRSMPIFWSAANGLSHSLISVDGTFTLTSNPSINYATGSIATTATLLFQFA